MAKLNAKAIVPIILTGIGIVGTIATIETCRRDTIKAQKMLEESGEQFENEKEKLKYTWKCYIPTMVSGGLTIASVAAAGYLNHKTEMALAAALAFNKENRKKFENKARKLFGDEAIKELKKDISKDDAKNAVLPKQKLASGLVRLYDPYTDQFLDTTIEKISLTMLALNKDLAYRGETYYNKFISLLGGKTSKNLDLLGWSFGNDVQSYNWSYEEGYWLELYTAEMNNDGDTFMCISFNVSPEIQGLEDYHDIS